MTDDAVAQALDDAVRSAFLRGLSWQGGAEDVGVMLAESFAREKVLPVLTVRIEQAVEEAHLLRQLARYRRGRKVAA